MDRLLGELEASADGMLSPGVSLPPSEVPLQNIKKQKNAAKEPENGKKKREKNAVKELVRMSFKFWSDGLKMQSKPESLQLL